MQQQTQPSYESQVQQSGGQVTGPSQGPQQRGLRLQDVETPEQRSAIDDIARAIQVCEWCADQCIQLGDPGMAECIRLCRDVSELGETALSLVPRNSYYARSVLQTFAQAAQACSQECGRHRHDHCQECTQVLARVSDSVGQFLGVGGQQPTQGGQMGMQQQGIQQPRAQWQESQQGAQQLGSQQGAQQGIQQPGVQETGSIQ